MIEISEELAQGLLDFLIKQPYKDVVKFVNAIMQASQKQNGKKPEEKVDG